jgi:mannose-6-phosphate isomerase-like protein (cupin superfamily)
LQTIKKSVKSIPPFTAGDETQIREILHPKNDALPIGYSLAYAELPPGGASLPHILKASSETYLIHQGKGLATVNGEVYELEQGEVLYIPAGAEQMIKNTGDEVLGFWCVVLPPWSAEEEEVL